ncbi:hypothetical protein VTO73DRAFT_12218 [Trametes versicolor]
MSAYFTRDGVLEVLHSCGVLCGRRPMASTHGMLVLLRTLASAVVALRTTQYRAQRRLPPDGAGAISEIAHTHYAPLCFPRSRGVHRQRAATAASGVTRIAATTTCAARRAKGAAGAFEMLAQTASSTRFSTARRRRTSWQMRLGAAAHTPHAVVLALVRLEAVARVAVGSFSALVTFGTHGYAGVLEVFARGTGRYGMGRPGRRYEPLDVRCDHNVWRGEGNGANSSCIGAVGASERPAAVGVFDGVLDFAARSQTSSLAGAQREVRAPHRLEAAARAPSHSLLSPPSRSSIQAGAKVGHRFCCASVCHPGGGRGGRRPKTSTRARSVKLGQSNQVQRLRSQRILLQIGLGQPCCR